MNAAAEMTDLLVLTADLDARIAMQALLSRFSSLRVAEFSSRVERFVKRDAGCFGDCHNYLRPFLRQFAHALVVFDRHGSGQEGRGAEQIEREVEQRLANNGWRNRSAAIVLDPELEIWVWSQSPHVPRILGWQDRYADLRAFLSSEGLLSVPDQKPRDPKAAMRRVLQHTGGRLSPSLFKELALRVSLRRCADRAFVKLVTTLRHWFAPTGVTR